MEIIHMNFFANNKKLIQFNHLWQSQLTYLYLVDIKKRENVFYLFKTIINVMN